MRPTTLRCQRGLTLVELMVGMALGLVVVSALLLIFANASTTGQNLNRASTQIENGRYVSELLHEDVRAAGFFGELPLAGGGQTITDPCSANPVGAFVNDPFSLPPAVEGIAPNAALGCLANRRADTAALVVRRVGLTTVAADAVDGSRLHVQYSFCRDDPAATRLVFGSDAAGFTLRNSDCSARNPVREYAVRIYFVANCNRCGVDNTPTLKRMDYQGGAPVETALVDGVEHLVFEYGFDTDGDGSADTYLPALGGVGTPTGSWANVMSIRAHYITRSVDRVAGANLATAQSFDFGRAGQVQTPADGHARRAYSTTIRLPNPSGAREVP